MSRILVIPDVHLKPWMFDKADEIDKSSYDNIVILGDLVDDWGKETQLSLYEETLKRALRFGTEHDKSLWCYGNHDVSYLWECMESGYSVFARDIIVKGIAEMQKAFGDRYQFIHRVDDVLFSHGGLTESFVLKTCRYRIKDRDKTNTNEVLQKINLMGKSQLWQNSSPIWARPQNTFYRMYREDLFYQVVGHTPMKTASEDNGVLSLDVFSTYRDGTPYGNHKFYIIDTVERSYSELS